MSNSNSLPRLALLIALVMVGPTLLTVTPATANTPAIIDALTAANLRPGSDFQRLEETTTFYLHTQDYFLSAASAPAEAEASGTIAQGDAFIMDLAAPTNSGSGQNSRGIAMGPGIRVTGPTGSTSVLPPQEQPRFDMTPGLAARDELRISQISASIYVGQYGSVPGLLPSTILMDVYQYPAGSERSSTPFTTVVLNSAGDAPISSGVSPNPGRVGLYTGDLALGGVLGQDFARGTTFSVQYRMENGAGVLWTDTTSYPSSISFKSDSARMALWTEDRRNDFRDVFPPGAASDAQDRVVNMVGVHFNVWGGIDCGDGTRVGACPIDNLDQSQHRMRIRPITIDDATGVRVAGDYIRLDQGNISTATVARCCNDQDRISYTTLTNAAGVFRYSFIYGKDFQDGIYEVELYQDNPFRKLSVKNDFRTGLVAFNIEPAPGELVEGGKIVHKAVAGQQTHFTVRVSNQGAALDTISISAPPPSKSGWSASVSASSLAIGPGQHRDVTVIVRTPSTAPNGESVDVVVSAVSALDQSLKTVILNTKIVLESANVPGVTLSSTRAQLEVRPNQDSATAIAIRNDGFMRDSFLISKILVGDSVGSNCADWIFTLNPPSITLHPSSRADLVVTVTPPVNTVPGTSCLATFQATRIGDSSVKHTLTVPIKVLVVNDVLLGVADSNERTWRENADDHATDDGPLISFGTLTEDIQGTRGFISDSAFDQTAIYRIQITNTGDQKDVYELRGSWNPNVGTHTARCAGGESAATPYDGIPNGWGFSLPPTGEVPVLSSDGYGANNVLATTQAAGFSGVYNLNDYEVNPGETIYVPLELGTWARATGDGCPNVSGPQAVSDEAEFSLTVRSSLDRTVVKRLNIEATLTAPGDFQRENVYAGSIHSVSIEMGLKDGRVASDLGLFTQDGPTDSISFPIRVVNKGNEKETMTIQVESGYEGWTHQIVAVATIHDGNSCTPNDSATVATRTLRCTAGVYDEVLANVVLTPPDDVDLGERHSVQIFSSVPGQEGVVSTSKRITARVVGTYDFQATTASPLLQAPLGGSVRLPFTIENLGTESDTYNIQIANRATTQGWTPTPSLTSVFVPSLGRWHGFVEVSVPSSAAATDPATQFQVLVTNSQALSKIVTMSAKPVASTSDLFLVGDPIDNLVRRSEPTSIFLKVSDLTGQSSTTVTRVSGLPAGWRLTSVKSTNIAFEDNQAVAEFQVTAPADALGTSRLPIRFQATAGNLSQQADVMINLASSYGVGIATPEENATLIQPGSHANFVLELTNRGLSQDTLEMTGVLGLPAGWSFSFSPTSVPLQPLESRDISLQVNAPESATPGQQLELAVFANSVGDATRGASTTVNVEVGLVKLEISPVRDPVYAVPEALVGHTLVLKNNGTLPLKNLVLSADGGTYASQIDPTFTTTTVVELLPGEVKETRLNFQLPGGIRQRANVPVDVIATSTHEAFANFTHTHTTNTVILPYTARDVDGDTFVEYAVDVNRDSRDGKEAFSESSSTTGVKTVCLSCSATGDPLLARFLTPEARASKMVNVQVNNVTTQRLIYVTDANDDGAVDHFLDTAGDQLPDRYWDPNRTVFQDLARATLSGKVLSLPKDVTGDGILDYFLDTDGDGLNANGVYDFATGTLDVYFDVTTGVFGDLIPVDINGDNIMDYVVDLNGNEKVDANEPVLFASAGRLASLQLADVDGDGTLDEVYTYQGRGPNCFIRKGAGADGRCIPITLKDVTGDGKEDWTYDIDNKGGIESYYDPVTGKSGRIDTQSQFVQSLKEYWYVSALFLVVAALFVILLAVTRR